MAINFATMVAETTTSTGTGNVVLSGTAVAGHGLVEYGDWFPATPNIGEQFVYRIESGSAVEVGLATVVAVSPFEFSRGSTPYFSTSYSGSYQLISLSGTSQVYVVDGARAMGRAEGLPDVQVFTSSGTWNKPPGCRWVDVLVVGPGAGGGSGASGDNTADRGGGGGGGGGANTGFVRYIASDLPSTITATIGAGTLGGAAVTGNSNGLNGGNAGESSFHQTSARGGLRGRGGAANSGGPSDSVAADPIYQSHCQGGAGARTGNGTVGSSSAHGASAGGGGGGLSTAGAAGNGGNSGNASPYTKGGGTFSASSSTGGTGNGSGNGANGQDGTATPVANWPSRGGGGGGAGSDVGGRGGDGAIGAGGGGGGGGRNGSGRGGNGGNGLVVVVSF